MTRRHFIAGLGAISMWALTARAQPGMPVIGFLSGRAPEDSGYLVAAFKQGLAEHGFGLVRPGFGEMA
jgi:hypothetical protein